MENSKLTKYQAAVISAYTGVLIGSFSDMHAYIETKLGRSCFDAELAGLYLSGQIQAITKQDFLDLEPIKQ